MSKRITDQSITIQMSARRLHDVLVQMYLMALSDVQSGRLNLTGGEVMPMADTRADELNAAMALNYGVPL